MVQLSPAFANGSAGSPEEVPGPSKRPRSVIEAGASQGEVIDLTSEELLAKMRGQQSHLDALIAKVGTPSKGTGEADEARSATPDKTKTRTLSAEAATSKNIVSAGAAGGPPRMDDPKSVAIVIAFQGANVGMEQRPPEDEWYPGHWGFFGGKFLTGESPEECAAREFHEESGIKIPPSNFLHVAKWVQNSAPDLKPDEERCFHLLQL